MDDDLQFIPWDIPNHLRPWVMRVGGFRDQEVGIVRREMLVVGCPMMFTFGSSYGLSEREAPDRITTTRRSFFAGMHDTFTMSRNDGPTEGLHVDLTPLGAYQLLGIPMHELSNDVIPVGDLLDREWRDLEERLGNLETWDERFALVERFLTSRLLDADRVSPEIRWAWRQMQASDGAVPVSVLTSELRWSRKRLRAAFLDEIGFPAKLIGRMLRYRSAVDLAVSHPAMPWSLVAVAAGYSDQAHLHRDVRAFAGTTPGKLRRELGD